MRALNKNKTKLWVVEVVSKTEIMTNKFLTGDYQVTYSVPKEIYLHLYPSNSVISNRVFGKDASFDMIAVTNDVVLTPTSLLFLTQPSANYGDTYDYSVSSIAKSLNTITYGLMGNVK